jgi:hypothetical protein
MPKIRHTGPNAAKLAQARAKVHETRLSNFQYCVPGGETEVVVLGSHTSWFRLMTSKNMKYMAQVEQNFNNIRLLGSYDRKVHEVFTINPRFSKDYSNDYTCLEEYFGKETVKEEKKQTFLNVKGKEKTRAKLPGR